MGRSSSQPSERRYSELASQRPAAEKLFNRPQARAGRHVSKAAERAHSRGVSDSVLLADSAAPSPVPPNFIEQLSPAERDCVLACAHRKVVHRGQYLIRQGQRHEGIFVIESGTIRSYYVAPSGRELTLAYWHAGNFVGGPDIFGRAPHVWSAVATADSVVWPLDGGDLRKLIRRLPNLALALIDALAFKGACYSASAHMLGTRSVTERLLRLLANLAGSHGVEDGNMIWLTARFSHQDLANMVGATRQWVSVSLQKLTNDALVVLERGILVGIDRRLLQPCPSLS